jgi:rhamnosyl/mannosyltransferase
MKVLVCNPDGDRVEEKVGGVDVVRAACHVKVASMPISFSLGRELKQAVKDRDIVHFHMPFPLGDFLLLFSGYHGKIIAWWHSDIVKQKFLLQLYRPIMKAFLKRVDCIMISDERNIESSKFLSPYKDKCVVIPYGIDVSSYSETVPCPCPITPSPNRKNILFVGRLVYYKGIDILLEAFSQVQRADLWLIGTGKMHPKLVQMAETLGLTGKIHFLGQVTAETRNACLRNCDIFVLPSVAKSEAFGLVQLEAMCCGKPVINTQLPTGVPYVSLHGETGITVEPGNVRALADAMQTLVDDDGLRERYGENARLRVEKYYTREVMTESVFREYQKLIDSDVDAPGED